MMSEFKDANLNALLNVINDVVFEINADQTITFVDPKIRQVTGFEPEEMIGREIFDFVAEWSHESLKKTLVSSFKEGKPVDKFLTTNLRKDGTYFPVSNSFIPLFGPQNQSKGHLVVGHDISDDLETQSKILQNHLMYQAVVETQTELICRQLADGTITFVNNAFCSYFDMVSTELIGTSFFKIIPKEAHETVRHAFRSRTLPQPFVMVEHRVLNSKGESRWQQWIHRALFREDGTFIEFQSSGRDVTEQKVAEERVLMFKTMADAANYGIVIYDLDGEIVYANAYFFKLHGVRPNKGKEDIGKLHSPSRMSLIRDIIDKLLMEESFNALEQSQKSGDGTTAPVLMNGVLIRDKNGKPSFVAVTVIDITEKKRAEEMIRQKNQDLEAKNLQLQEMNSALKVLLEQRAKDKEEMEEVIISNLRDLVLPCLQNLHNIDLAEEDKANVNLLERNLIELLSPYLRQVKNRFPTLTKKELQVLTLIKDGLSTKEISDLMGISMAAINLHRHNIRQKLGLNKSKHTLSEYLLSEDIRLS